MNALEQHHITDLFVRVDDSLPKVSRPLGGRPPLLTDSELITLILWNLLTVQQHTFKDIWRWARREKRAEFPQLPEYPGFMLHLQRILPLLAGLLQDLLVSEAPVRFVDSTMLEVCRECRADRHKVAQGFAAWGKNHQGWHLGFKLHAAIDTQGNLAAVFFTPANESDILQVPHLTRRCLLAVGDAGYTARVMRGKLWDERRCFILSPPRQKQVTQVMAGWQEALLKMRPKIEAAFDRLKEHLHLVTSFPRSVMGYFIHYLAVLIGYQLLRRGF